MGYYCAWGDAKVTCSSEEEGYETRASGSRQNRNRVLGICGETVSNVQRREVYLA